MITKFSIYLYLSNSFRYSNAEYQANNNNTNPKKNYCKHDNIAARLNLSKDYYLLWLFFDWIGRSKQYLLPKIENWWCSYLHSFFIHIHTPYLFIKSESTTTKKKCYQIVSGREGKNTKFGTPSETRGK